MLAALLKRVENNDLLLSPTVCLSCLVPKSCPHDTTLPFCWQPRWLADIWNVSPDTMELVNCKKSENLGCLCNDARGRVSPVSGCLDTGGSLPKSCCVRCFFCVF